MKVSNVLWLTVLAPCAAAQATDDLFNSILSDARSIYTYVTSVLASAPATTSASTTGSASLTSSLASTTPSSTSSSTSSTTLRPTGSSSSASPSATAVASTTPSSTAKAVPQSTSPAASNTSGGGGGNNTLAIVLGCTLGALAFAAFLALLFFCFRRRRRVWGLSKHRSLSPNDEEIETWRHEKPRVRSFKGPEADIVPVAANGPMDPLMREPARDYHGYERQHNPFVPIPPSARRSSRPGLQDTEYSSHPYSPEHINGHGTGNFPEPGHAAQHADHAMAAGLGGAALGGLAAHAKHRHDRKRSGSRGRHTDKHDPAFSEDEYNALPQTVASERRSGSLGRANTREAWPFTDAHERRSTDSGIRGRRSMSRSEDHFLTPDQHPADSHPMPSHIGLLGAAAMGGTMEAAATHHHGHRSSYPKGILKQTVSGSSDPSSNSDQPRSDQNRNSRPEAASVPLAHNSGPHELASADIPDAPMVRDRRNSAFGTAASLAAGGAIGAGIAGRRRSNSGGWPSREIAGPEVLGADSQPYEAPNVPSRSPKRASLDTQAQHSMANENRAELPGAAAKHGNVSPPLNTERFDHDDRIASPVSPITASNPGTLTKNQAEELAHNRLDDENKTSSQDSTIVESTMRDRNSSESSDQQSSGLVSAIQRIFNSQKTAWAEEQSEEPLRRSRGEDFEVAYNNDQQHRIASIPHRKPAPARLSQQPVSQHGEIENPYTTGETVQGGPDQTYSAYHTASDRKSGESARSQPPRYRSRGDSSNNVTSTTDFVVAPAQNGSRPRPTSRPAYGPGSGDPFDLARVRTDSSMTGLSLSGQHESSDYRPPAFRSSSGSHDYREPTLAQLRQQVQEEDRERVRKAWARRHSRSNSMGLRYGDDRELFDLVDQTTGRGDHDPDPGRYYAQQTNPRNLHGVGRAV